MYVCNIMTQPGETDKFKVSDHIKVIEKYLGKNSVDVVIANTSPINEDMKLMAKSEGKEAVKLDEAALEKMGVEVIADKLFKVEVVIDDLVYGVGVGGSKKEAEQNAAKEAYMKRAK